MTSGTEETHTLSSYGISSNHSQSARVLARAAQAALLHGALPHKTQGSLPPTAGAERSAPSSEGRERSLRRRRGPCACCSGCAAVLLHMRDAPSQNVGVLAVWTCVGWKARADVKLKIRSPSQWLVPVRDSDGGSRLSQDDFSDVESFLGETAHLQDRL